MGGLIVRRAIAGVQNKVSGFPSKIYIEDVVTLATPHGGAPDAIWCNANTQCAQIRPGSDFLEDLAKSAKNPQSSIGSDWSVIASESDPWVSTSSATKMDAGHQYVYLRNNGLDHSEVRTHSSTAKTFDIRWEHVEGNRSGTDYNGAATLYVTAAALYRWRSW
jgi:hypothetical protein